MAGKVVEIDEAELQQFMLLGKNVNDMLQNKEARGLLLRAQKMAHPEAVIPEIDVAGPVESRLAEITRALADDKAERDRERQEAASQRELEKFERKLDAQRTRLRNQGWTDDGIREVEKHAESQGVADLEIAAAHYEKLHPPAEPIQPNGQGSWGFMDESDQPDKFVQAMVESKGKDDSALMREARAAIAEVRQQAQRR